ncbi:hypothetical protein [Marinimicrobium sp. ARAG 43.8]|uniref:hypothetical protein n=1 Tax=Marinimicrobium sp. ARAG 43.8 TaxID=3418719 RepID=UPI003CF150D0
MTHFKIVMTGSSILVDHYGSTEPIVGFVACRLLKAESEELAIATAKRDILVQWNQSFNADRKAGLPKLSIEKISTIRPWLTRKPKHDFYFYVSDEQRFEHLQKLTRTKHRWFGRTA